MQSKGASESDEPYKECVGHVFHRIPLDLEKLAAAGDRLPKGRELEAKLNTPQRRVLDKAQELIGRHFGGGFVNGQYVGGNHDNSGISASQGGLQTPNNLKDLFGRDKHLFTPLIADILELSERSFADLESADANFYEDAAGGVSVPGANYAALADEPVNKYLPNPERSVSGMTSNYSALSAPGQPQDAHSAYGTEMHQALGEDLLSQFGDGPSRSGRGGGGSSRLSADAMSSAVSRLSDASHLHSPDPNCDKHKYHKG